MHNKRILITGGKGFLGKAICQTLKEHNIPVKDIAETTEYKKGEAYTFSSNQIDLTTQAQTNWLFKKIRPDTVIHLAAVVGGIQANKNHPGTFFYKNMAMGMNVLEACVSFNVEKILLTGTICSYPKYTDIPFKEEDFWNGYPEETNAPYGIAKKALITQAQAYQKEYGLQSVNVLPVNMYGPYDNFDLETSHVIPALIRKFYEAKKYGIKEVTLWGTGTPTREFLYVKDAAEAIITAIEKHTDNDIINIGTGRETSIAQIAEMISKETNYRGKINWDETRPDGQPRRSLDTTKAQTLLGFTAKTTLEEGISKTVRWYKHEQAQEI